MTKLLTDEEIASINLKCFENFQHLGPRTYADAIEAAVMAKLGGPLLNGYVEKAIMEDRRKWRALIGEPVLIVGDPQDPLLELYELPKELKCPCTQTTSKPT